MHDRLDSLVSWRPRVEPSGHPRRHRIRAVRFDMQSPECRDSVMTTRLRTCGERRCCERKHRVVSICEPSGSGVICHALKGEPPPAMRPDPGTDTHGRVEVDKCVALFNVQLDEDTDARESLVVSTKAT